MILVVVGLLGAACNGTQTTQTQTPVASTAAHNTTTAPSLDLQERCSDKSIQLTNNRRMTASDELGVGLMGYDYSNHYNAGQNRCFVYVTYSYSNKYGFSSVQELYDAYENNYLGGCVSSKTKDYCAVGDNYDANMQDFKTLLKTDMQN